MPPVYAVTGATGGLGGMVAARLAGRGMAQRLVVRDPDRAPRLAGAEVVRAAYQDGPAMRRALHGADTLLLVSATEHADRVRLHTTAVDAAAAAGVRRLVYVSFLGAASDATFTFARDHAATEDHVRTSGLAYTFLRDSMYMEYMPLLAGPDGVIRGPAADGRLAPVAREDVADVAVGVLTGTGHEQQTYDVTGGQRLGFDDVAAELSAVSGRAVRYARETLEEAYASRGHYGAPAWEVQGWVTSYAAVAAGELDIVSDTVERIAGHPPVHLATWLRAHPDSWAHLRG